jgi:hypothetical protein
VSTGVARPRMNRTMAASSSELWRRTTSAVSTIALTCSSSYFGSDAASAIGQHWNALKHFLHTGDSSELEPFASLRIQGHRFAVDLGWIERWAAQGELDFEDIYEAGGW